MSELTHANNLDHRAKVISGSADGFVRICDLNSRSVLAPYQWNAHVANPAVRGVAGLTQLSENELILLRDDLTLSTFDLRSHEVSVRVKRLGGGHMERISVDPREGSNNFCVYGPEAKTVEFYDARMCAKPIHYIARSNVATADYSPDGKRFLISRYEIVCWVLYLIFFGW